MYLGHLVEMASAEALYADPCHPYTEALLSAVPIPNPELHRRRIILKGEVPDPANPPPGCKFRPRCRYAEEICKRKVPQWRKLDSDHWVACHLTEKLKLTGIA